MPLASKYRYKIQIQNVSTARDENRQPIKTYTPYKSKYTMVKFLGGNESEQNQQTKSKQRVEFTFRFDATIAENMAVLYEGRQFNITSITPMRKLGETKINCEIIE